MIVMADPLGDFNATSQILRYSALAREVTAPRIPSADSTFMAHISHSNHPKFPHCGPSHSVASESDRETMEFAALEISRMSEEIDGLRAELRYEMERRSEVEAYADMLSNRINEVESEVREECFLEMEKRMELEMRRWKATWALEADLKDEHIDRKLEIFTRSVDNSSGSGEDKENINEEATGYLETENLQLKREVEKLRRKIQGSSPSKSKRLPLLENRSMATPLGLSEIKLRVSPKNSVNKNSQTCLQNFQKKLNPLTSQTWEPNKSVDPF